MTERCLPDFPAGSGHWKALAHMQWWVEQSQKVFYSKTPVLDHDNQRGLHQQYAHLLAGDAMSIPNQGWHRLKGGRLGHI